MIFLSGPHRYFQTVFRGREQAGGEGRKNAGRIVSLVEIDDRLAIGAGFGNRQIPAAAVGLRTGVCVEENEEEGMLGFLQSQ